MPLQTLNWGPTPGSQVATGLGSGLSQGMQALANMKMQEYAQRNQLALQQQAKMQGMQQQHDLLEQTLGPGWGKLAFLPEKTGLMAIQGGWNPATPQTGMQQNIQALNSEQAAQPNIPSGFQVPTATTDLGQAISQGAYNTPQMKQARELQAQQQKFTAAENEKKAERQEKQFFHGKGEKFYEKLQDQAESASNMQLEIDKMKQLVESDQLPQPEYVNAIDKLSNTIFGTFINPNSLYGKSGEEYNKLAATLMTGAKDIFGSRVTNFDMAQFLKMMPTLMNTKEGKLEIIHDLSLLNQMKIEHAAMANEIAQKNKGYIPSTFRGDLNEKFDKRRKELAEEFKKSYQYKPGQKIKVSQSKNLPVGQRGRMPDGSIAKWDGKNWIKES